MSAETQVIVTDTLAIHHLPPSRDVYVFWSPNDPHPLLAHYCLSLGEGRKPGARWRWANTGLHTVVADDPLHLEPSIGWMECCGRHGFIRNGQWEPAGDGGWQPIRDGGNSDG